MTPLEAARVAVNTMVASGMTYAQIARLGGVREGDVSRLYAGGYVPNRSNGRITKNTLDRIAALVPLPAGEGERP